MVAKDHRIVITLNADNYKAVQERVGTDNHEEVTELVKSAVISLANGAPEPTRKARQKIERMAKREAELAVKRAKLLRVSPQTLTHWFLRVLIRSVVIVMLRV